MVDNQIFKYKDDTILGLRACAEYGNVGWATIANACRDGRLKAHKNSRGRWQIKKSDYDDYRLHRYSRRNTMFNGSKLYDLEKGRWSPAMVAKIFSEAQGYQFALNKVYYELRIGRLPSYLLGKHYVVKKEDAIRYFDMYYSDVKKKNIS